MLNKLLKKYAKNEKGLTLIELLVVIVILGIIAAIAVVSIGGIVGKTKDKAAVTEAVQIINAAKLAQSEDSKKVSWTPTELESYVSNLKDTTWTVTLSGKEYKIANHEGGKVAAKTPDAEATVTEEQLTSFLNQ
ncbi:type II secretion system protein [Fictibacillus sp. b24]|uniref:type II secretion system protein n=1 Tax=Fictibacillus sp. b24 TaxID=3055863 RepID=UPI0025A1F2F6|nr:type II secretion system protein [Fictibacillus sp. b24]MDM5315099.1 type II secretion system protein [Fictibacillus sp. b24]